MKNCVIVFLLVIVAGTSYGKKLRLDLDLAEFRNNDSTSIWEMYYVFPDTTLSYIYHEGKYIGEMYFHVSIVSEDTGTIVADKEWVVFLEKDIPSEEFKMNLFGQKNFLVPIGKHKFKLQVNDINDTTTSAEKEFGILSMEYSEEKLSISNIQLAQKIEESSEKTNDWNKNFLKNSLFVIPNPRNEYIGENPVLYFYAEIYNAKELSPDGYAVVYEIFDTTEKLKMRIKKQRESFANAIVETIRMPIDELPTGVYILSMKILNPKDDPVDSTFVLKKFYVINPNKPPMLEAFFVENLSFEQSEFVTLTAEQVQLEYDKIRYIIQDYEEDLFEVTETLKAKQKFLFRFWARRNPDTTQIVNANREEYRNRIESANKRFSYGLMRKGWSTDRGRIHLLYGEPTEIERNPINNALRAYDVWFYAELQGGIYFYFVDRHGFGNYILVHSTVTGEMRNENWFDENVDTDNLDPFRKRMQYDGR